jgi:FAD-linked oxidoreductase
MRWKNWSGSVEANPTEIIYPASEQEIVNAINRARQENKKIRVVGSGHSFSRVAESNQILMSLDDLQGIIEIDKDNCTATVWAGTKLKALGEWLFENDLAQENMGDINVQSLAGALGTGTHGTGKLLGTLSTQILEVTYINGLGEVKTIGGNSEELQAIQLSLGTLGVFTRIKLRLEKAYKLKEVTKKETLSDCLENVDKYIEENRNFEFFWFPHTDKVQIKFLNKTEEDFKRPGFGKRLGDIVVENWMFFVMCKMAQLIPSFSKSVAKLSAWGIANGTYVDWSHNIYATKRDVKFFEMEYNVPIEHLKTVLLEIEELILKEDINVHFPVECRMVQNDDIMISPAYQRDAAYIAVHQFNGMPYKDFFKKAEAIFNKYNGRPHWGKINFQTGDSFKTLYPKWEEFKSIRDREDPKRIFLNEYLEEIF